MMIVLAAVGGLFLWSRFKNGGTNVPLSNLLKPQEYKPWSAPRPSATGSEGTGETSPLTAILLRFKGGLSSLAQPAPYVPLSGAGGATVAPGASGAPAGTPQNTLQAAAPGTLAEYSVRNDIVSAADPRYWWMMPTVDVAIMSDDVNGALAAAGDVDLSQAMIEASIGAEWRT
jgi:hypothetical protein